MYVAVYEATFAYFGLKGPPCSPPHEEANPGSHSIWIGKGHKQLELRSNQTGAPHPSLSAFRGARQLFSPASSSLSSVV